MGAVSSRVVHYPNGYGYEIRPDENSQSVIDLASDFLGEYGGSIDEVLEKFGGMTKNDLEVLSTAIYVDREAAGLDEELSTEELIHRVHEIKRNFAERFVADKVAFLEDEDLLESTE
jgi:KaiC/GvpD/RAD55 family RecA-like ATPase